MKDIIKVSASLLIAAGLIMTGCFSGSQMEQATTTRPSQLSSATPVLLSVQVDQPGASITPMFYGLMTEEINHSYDGGLYAELIQNRIFQNSQLDVGTRGGGGGAGRRGRGATNPASAPAADGAPATPPPQAPNYLIHWSVVNSDGASGNISIDTNEPVNTKALMNSLKLDIASVGNNQRVGVANDGYWGIPVKPNTEYKASFYARASAGMSSPLTVAIESNDGKTTYASGTIPPIGTKWQKVKLTLKTSASAKPTTDARFVVSASKPGSLWLSLVSLFPPTYNNRPNGNRIDIMQKLIDLKPGFLRYPGGNYLEGRGLAERWAWKNTLGPLEDRLGHGNTAWRYRASDGMGMLEFMEWCEDMKVEPVLAVYSGFSLQGSYVARTPEEVKPFVEEGLDAIEFVMGDANTKWGAERARLGHPAPFKLTYVEVGNEEHLGGGNATYAMRFEAFHDAIKAKYPDLKIISAMQGARANASTLTRKPDVVDDHYYSNNLRQALQRSHLYDVGVYERGGPKVFIGEYALRTPSTGDTCNLTGGIGDAAFLTGMERNADVVIMTGYAPLLTNVNPAGVYPAAKQWNVDLIGYDGLTSFGSPSYYVQKMFSENRGDVVLPASMAQLPMMPAAAGQPASQPQGGRGGGPNAPVELVYTSATRDNATGDVILKLVNAGDDAQPIEVDLQGVKSVHRTAALTVLTGNPDDINTVAEPTKVAPKKTTINYAATKFMHELPAHSVSVVRLKTK